MTESAAVERFRTLYEANRRDVLAYFLRRLDVESANDCTDEVFLTAWRRLDDVPTDRAARPWLFGVAHNVLSSHQRGSRRRLRLIARLRSQPVQPAAGPETMVMRRAGIGSVTDALEHLSHADREILRLAYWEKLPHREIGRILGCSTGAVDVRLHRATRRLGKGLDRAGHVSSGRPAVLPDQGGETC
ncbi:MAG: sigma-70 family RNA polymerase sigma factor [Acidimicrobiia bacterium]|nr:sigma-70 family RNA polymerase sigma factor [Acidimicrobiia bacterium]